MDHSSFAFYLAILRKNFVSYCAERLSALGVTYGQLYVLIYIGKRDACSSKDIGEYLKLDGGQLNRIVAKLVEKGLITQEKSSKDRRRNILSLTTSGIKTVAESHALFQGWDEQVLAALDDTSRRELMELMKKLVLKCNEKQGGARNGPVE